MQENKQSAVGYVFALDVPGMFGILRYSPTTHVVVFVTRDEPTTWGACERLNKGKQFGKFKVANHAEMAWGRLTLRNQPMTELLAVED